MAFPDEDAWDLEAALTDEGEPALDSHGSDDQAPDEETVDEQAADRSGTRKDDHRLPPNASPRPTSPDEPARAPEEPLDEDWPIPAASHLDWDEEPAKNRRGQVYTLVQVRFRDRAKMAYFDAGEQTVPLGERVVVETEQGLIAGQVVQGCHRAVCEHRPPPLLRPMSAADHRQEARNQEVERQAFLFCKERIAARKMAMKLVRVEVLHGGGKAIFFFASETRVDFRDLVKDLTQQFHLRVVMRQIGVRDEARVVGGLGTCGCELCCTSWLPRFEPVSIRMAKDQNMVLNPQKVSGQCGRLKCCLGYELEQYMECRKGLPKPGRRVSTPDGEGRVQEVDILRRLIRVSLGDGISHTYSPEQLAPPAPQDEPKQRGNE